MTIYVIAFCVAIFINCCVRVITLNFLLSTFFPILYSFLFFVKYFSVRSSHYSLFILFVRSSCLAFVLPPFSARTLLLCFPFLRRLRYHVFFIELLIKTRPLYRPPVNSSLLRDRRFRRITSPFHDNPPFPRRRKLTSTSVTADVSPCFAFFMCQVLTDSVAVVLYARGDK